MIDHRRIVRTICDILSVGTGAFCLYGLTSFTDVSGNQFALLLLTLFGAVAGILVGCTENQKARRFAIVLTTAMSLFHLYIQFVIWQQGTTTDYAEPIALIAVPVIILIVAQAVDWFTRRGYRRVESKKTEKPWLRKGRPILRLLNAFIAAYRGLALAIFLAYGPTGTKSPLWGFVVGCLIQLALGVLHTVGVWLQTDATAPGEEVVMAGHSLHEKSSVPHVAKPSL